MKEIRHLKTIKKQKKFDVIKEKLGIKQVNKVYSFHPAKKK